MPISYNSLVSSKTMYRTTLTSGTSYTVPAGVTYLNVTLYGGGGGAGGSSNSVDGRQGGSGAGGQIVSSTLSATAGASISYAIGAGGGGGATGGTGGNGAAGGSTTFTGATSASGGTSGGGWGVAGSTAYGFGNGGMQGNGGFGGSAGGAGGAGKIDIEYWAQEIMMRTFAVIENNKVTNIIVGVEPEVVAANPGKYIDYTDGWDYNNGIDGGVYFPAPVTEPDAL